MSTGFTILFHSSKTMRASSEVSLKAYSAPPLLEKAQEIAGYMQTLDPSQLMQAMKLSPVLAEKTHSAWQSWQERKYTLPAIDAFQGDMYSGLQSRLFRDNDREYAQGHLFILSGLYGVVRALDNIHPYRLEMAYRMPDAPYDNLYSYWDSSITGVIPTGRPILNLSVQEYTKTVLPYTKDRVITPLFLTIKSGDTKPRPVVVHSKIARGAFARWVVMNRVESEEDLRNFSELGYHYNATLSTPSQPVYVTKKFQGIGLSVRTQV